MKALGIIPARGGSKTIPRKNLVPLLGRPLISYTFQAAKQSQLLDRLILSTDDEEIAAFARSEGIEVPFMRPPSLAGDTASMLPVLQHVLEALLPYRPDVLVLLQPTSPLRTAEHIDAAIRLMQEQAADSVVTVVEVPHQFNPVSVMLMADGSLSPYSSGPQILRRQDKPKVYARNGPTVLVTRTEVVESGNLYGPKLLGLEMGKTDSLDIDDLDDLATAEFWLRRRGTS